MIGGVDRTTIGHFRNRLAGRLAVRDHLQEMEYMVTGRCHCESVRRELGGDTCRVNLRSYARSLSGPKRLFYRHLQLICFVSPKSVCVCVVCV